jgi:predicted DNA-binding protein
MERTTVYLDAELRRRLKEVAVRRGRTEASLIREALAQHLVDDEPVALEPVGRSEDGGVAEKDEEALRDLGFGES